MIGCLCILGERQSSEVGLGKTSGARKQDRGSYGVSIVHGQTITSATLINKQRHASPTTNEKKTTLVLSIAL